jgi:ribosome biogenesis GTPase
LTLKNFGWNSSYDTYLKDKNKKDLIFGRVIKQNGKHYKIISENGEENAILPNSFFKKTENKSEIPAVGDWVGLKKNIGLKILHIDFVLPRKNQLSRKVAGKKSEEQIIASNIDLVFIITSADQDFNVRRFERYLSMVYEINAKPVIILNKIDKINDLDKYLKETEFLSKKVPILSISAKTGLNIDDLEKYIKPGKTIVLIGSSGVGKSTLINYLLGFSRQSVGEIRKTDGKGRHITTSRELIILPNGGMLIDNPGIREIQLWTSGKGISKTFEDIEEISRNCKFKNCLHEQEPECAVKRAVEKGQISIDRLNSFKKLIREQEYSELRRNIYEKRKKDRQLGKMYRQGSNIRRIKGKK